jgi:protein phosphatase
MALLLRSVARSDVGRAREQNEDSGYAGPRVVVVADGMGGHAAGEVASAVSVETVADLETLAAGFSPDEAEDAVAGAVARADTRIQDLVEENPARRGMGTTLTAMIWTGDAVVLGHIGDSRGYLLRDGQLTRLTHDHTYVQSLVDEGRITEEQARDHPARSLILKALDGRGDPEPDVSTIPARAGDRFLICSDGLTGVVPDDVVRDVLSGEPDLGLAADALVLLALDGGGPDNITLVLADVIEAPASPGAQDTFEAHYVGAAADMIRRREAQSAGAADAPDAAEHPPDGDDEMLRYAPQPPRRYRWLRRLLAAGVAIAVVVALATLAVGWAQGQYFVGDQDGQVATFRGLTQDLGPLGPSLVSEAGELPVAALPANFQRQVAETIPASDDAHATRITTNLRVQACRLHPPTTAPYPGLDCTGVVAEPTPSPTPTPSPGFPAPGSTQRPTPTGQPLSASGP